MQALEGLRVVDLSPTELGGHISQLLADFGAEVVWVEAPAGAALREERSFPFLARGKRSVVLDLKSDIGRGALLELIDGADVLIETFRPGVAARLGVAYDELRERNPALVYASVTGFGTDSAFAGAPGYEGLVAAKLGVFAAFAKMHDEERPPFLAVPWCTFAASQATLHGILAALLERERSGLGQHVETNLAQSFASLDTWNWFVRLINDRYPGAYPSADAYDEEGRPVSPLIFMLLAALTKDGRWLQFAQVAPHLYAALLGALDLGWVLQDPAWATVPLDGDADQRLALWTMMLEAAGKKTLAEWEAIFEADPNVFAELFRSGTEVLDHPQLIHDDRVVEVDDHAFGRIRQIGPLADLLGTPGSAMKPAPALGDTGLGAIDWSARPAATTVERADMPLDGVLVLELASHVAAPYGATVLTDLGARVIKVEPLAGDPVRNMVAFPEASGAKVMQGKDSICVDIASPDGLAIVHRIAERADVVLQSYRSGVAERHGFDAATLRAINPDVVHVHAAGYGAGPPNGHRPSFAPSIAAAGGVSRANAGAGVPEQADMDIDAVRRGSRHMLSAGTAVNAQADGCAALGVATTLLLGLLARERGAGGQDIEASMLVTAAHLVAEPDVERPTAGGRHVDPELRGFHARYRIYDASDGWVFLAAPQEREWGGLVAILEDHVDLASDERFATEALRRANDADLVEVLAGAFAKGARADWERVALATGVGCVAVTTECIESMMWSDFGRTAGYLVDVVHPTFDAHPRLAPLVRFSRSATQAKPGVLAGSSTDAVLAELGYTPHDVEDLRARGVVG